MGTTSGPALILDAWAFIEQVFDGSHRAALDARRRAAGRTVTTRDALVETYTFILKRTRRPHFAREWWRTIRESDIVIQEATLDEIDDFLRGVPGGLGLSIVDITVALAARKERTTEIATGDRAFADIGLTPLFADT